MLFKSFLLTVAFMFAVMFSSCTSKEEKVEEAVTPQAAEEPASPEDTSLTGATDVVPETVYFAFDDYTLSAEAQASLNNLADQLKKNTSAVIQVEGNCDERGSIEYNLALGERRAQSVKNYLTQLGIDPSRITTISYGEEKPAVEGHDEAAWAKNRRAEFVVSGQ